MKHFGVHDKISIEQAGWVSHSTILEFIYSKSTIIMVCTNQFVSDLVKNMAFRFFFHMKLTASLQIVSYWLFLGRIFLFFFLLILMLGRYYCLGFQHLSGVQKVLSLNQGSQWSLRAISSISVSWRHLVAKISTTLLQVTELETLSLNLSLASPPADSGAANEDPQRTLLS